MVTAVRRHRDEHDDGVHRGGDGRSFHPRGEEPSAARHVASRALRGEVREGRHARVPHRAEELRGEFSGVQRADVHPAGEGPAQRQHPSARRRAPHTHRLQLHAEHESGRHQLRERAVQADSRVPGGDGLRRHRHGLRGVQLLQGAVHTGVPRRAQARGAHNQFGGDDERIGMSVLQGGAQGPEQFTAAVQPGEHGGAMRGDHAVHGLGLDGRVVHAAVRLLPEGAERDFVADRAARSRPRR
mmetsp:Transcript_4786/g.19141  ORF Transcript_4786/g.19141 Transcript_4786/m.19141 type:complete len:242 (-) Transcript_4786:67-792(-)